MKDYKILFCDLDDTLISRIEGQVFPIGVWDTTLRLDVWNAIKKLNPSYVCIVTNQSGIEGGFVNEKHFIKKCEFIKASLSEYLNKSDDSIDFIYCSTRDNTCKNRKPNPGMLEEFCKKNNLENKEDCLMIGDASGEDYWSDSDKMTAMNFGIDYIDVDEFTEKMNRL